MGVVDQLTAMRTIVAFQTNPDNGTINLGFIAMTERWTRVTDSESIVDGAAKEVVVDGNIVAIFRYQGRLYAMDGMCAHQGGPLAEGTVEAGCVTCPWHGWQYELATGIQTINRQPLQTVFPVREVDGHIELDLSEQSP